MHNEVYFSLLQGDLQFFGEESLFPYLLHKENLPFHSINNYIF
jgi:hypothetical protein